MSKTIIGCQCIWCLLWKPCLDSLSFYWAMGSLLHFSLSDLLPWPMYPAPWEGRRLWPGPVITESLWSSYNEVHLSWVRDISSCQCVGWAVHWNPDKLPVLIQRIKKVFLIFYHSSVLRPLLPLCNFLILFYFSFPPSVTLVVSIPLPSKAFVGVNLSPPLVVFPLSMVNSHISIHLPLPWFVFILFSLDPLWS